MALNTLKDLFCNRLEDVYNAEKQLGAIMPRMAQSAQTSELKELFTREAESNSDQLARLEDVYRALDVSHDGVTSSGMRGIIEEGEAILSEPGDSLVKDAALICIAQEMKHYEIATYGSLRSWAYDLAYPEVAKKLQTILRDEGGTDKKLTTLAEGNLFKTGINKSTVRK